MTRGTRLATLILTILAAPGTAAAAPGNDARDDAQRISRLPATVTGDLRSADLRSTSRAQAAVTRGARSGSGSTRAARAA